MKMNLPKDRFRPKAALHEGQSSANSDLLARQGLAQPTSYIGQLDWKIDQSPFPCFWAGCSTLSAGFRGRSPPTYGLTIKIQRYLKFRKT